MEDYTKCYKFYNWKGGRIAAFARKTDDTTVEIYTLHCSKKDPFSKKYARTAYEDYITYDLHGRNHPIIVNVALEDTVHQTMMKYLGDSYPKLYTVYCEIEKEVLIMRDENDEIIDIGRFQNI